MRTSLAVIFLLGPFACHAQNLTSFTPDIVMECREHVGGKISDSCQYSCLPIPRPPNDSMNTWPPVVWRFERLEFFSKAGRESESWLIAMKGRTDSPAIHKNAVSFLTLGHSYLCQMAGSPEDSNPVVDVLMTKYY